MAIDPDQSILDLLERTATADSDLIHVNSGGTDYKEQKVDFLRGDFQHSFGNTSALTSQIDSLGSGTYYGTINGYGSQTTTGLPINANCYVRVQKIASTLAMADIWSASNPQEDHWMIKKSSSSWSSWEHVPARSEITSLNNSLTYKSYSVTVTANTYVSPYSYYGSIGITADKTAYGTPIAVNVTGGQSGNVAQAKMSGNSIYIYSKSEETFTVYVLYCKASFLTVV